MLPYSLRVFVIIFILFILLEQVTFVTQQNQMFRNGQKCSWNNLPCLYAVFLHLKLENKNLVICVTPQRPLLDKGFHYAFCWRGLTAAFFWRILPCKLRLCLLGRDDRDAPVAFWPTELHILLFSVLNISLKNVYLPKIIGLVGQ